MLRVWFAVFEVRTGAAALGRRVRLDEGEFVGIVVGFDKLVVGTKREADGFSAGE